MTSDWRTLAISNRIPGWGQILPVYAVIVLMLYSWTTLSLFWLVPSWLYFMHPGEILQVFAYGCATNLVESLAVLCALVIPSLVLPSKWFHDRFVARGSALAMSGLGYMMFVAFQYTSKADYPRFALNARSLALAVAIILLLVFLAGRIDSLRKGIEFFADQATVFLYVSIPLSVVALVGILIHLAI